MIDELIKRLQERIRRSPAVECDALCEWHSDSGEELPPRPPNPPVPQAALEAFEGEFGFRLPTLVRRLYTEVADAGYGPCWGINPLWSPPGTDFELWWEEPMSVEAWYRLYRQERENDRPPGYWQHSPDPSIRFCEVGCGISICLDCTTDEGRVFMDDPNLGQEASECLLPLADSVAQWLSDWLERPWPEGRYP
jgi:SMI1/KNR4 family protein SUKH-1